jgi:hypothetical protein
MKAIILHLFFVLILLVSPVCAQIEITAEPLGTSFKEFIQPGKVSNLTVDVSTTGDAIQRIAVDLDTGTAVNFTLTYGSGQTVSGWMEYENDGFYTQHSEVAIDTDIQGYSYVGIQEIGRADIVGYAKNWTSASEYDTGFVVYDSVFGYSDRRIMAFYPIAGISDSVIYKFEITSTKPCGIVWITDTRGNVGKAAGTTIFDVGNEWVQFALSMGSLLLGIVTALAYWLKFIFIDNIVMEIALYLSISMAYSACTAKNIFQFFRKFFKDQRAFFTFLLELVMMLVNLVATFRGIFRI